MVILRHILLAGSVSVAVAAAGAQNTPAASTPQTGSAAPAATRSIPATPPPSANAGGAATGRSSGRARRSGNRTGAQTANQNSTGTSVPNGKPGITGVPEYRAGFRGSGDTAAAESTAAVTVTGVNDGSRSSTQPAALPGITLPHNAYGIPKGTLLHVRLQQPVDSGHARNGDTVRGVLTGPAGNAPAGVPVELTVVAVAPAGRMSSHGEISLQVVTVNGEHVLSDVITAEGNEGAKLLPDDAPGRGTEAVFTPEQPLTLPAG